MSRKVIAIMIAAVLAISAVWYVVMWSPQGASLKKAQASAASAQTKESSLKAQVAALQKQRAQLPVLNAQIAALKQAIPATANIDQVIDQVNAVTRDVGVTLVAFSPPAIPAAAVPGTPTVVGAVPMSLSVSVTGTYFQLIKLINELNAMPRLAVVDGFSLGTPDKSGNISTTITARVFLQPAAATPATTTTTTGSK